MMPVEKLPAASWQTAFGLGFVSAVFDNIPLTALALKQGGYDWGFLAYAVGFGGSMIWFGSSAGVALSNLYPEAKSVGRWLRHGWHVAVAYVVGFFVLLRRSAGSRRPKPGVVLGERGHAPRASRRGSRARRAGSARRTAPSSGKRCSSVVIHQEKRSAFQIARAARAPNRRRGRVARRRDSARRAPSKR